MSYRSVKVSQGMLTQLVNKEEQTFIASSFIVISYSLFHFPISSLLYPISNIHDPILTSYIQYFPLHITTSLHSATFILYPTPCLPYPRKLRKYPQE